MCTLILKLLIIPAALPRRKHTLLTLREALVFQSSAAATASPGNSVETDQKLRVGAQ
jgi:hypothetical protein